MPAAQPDSDLKSPKVSVALIARDDERRRAIAKVISGTRARLIQEFSDYPNGNIISKLIDGGCDVIIVDLDFELEPGLDLIRTACKRDGSVTVMACSLKQEANVVISAMQAGAREFLTVPIVPETITEAFVRACDRHKTGSVDRAPGKLVVFQGSKGGAGVTTLATNFAIALTKECAGEIVIVDLHPQLGEVALGLGIIPQFSVADAMGNAGRLDADFLSTLMVKHESGLMVLASSDVYGTHRSLERGAEKLLRIMREEFAFVVVDAGSCSGNIPDALFDLADTVYLVTEANLPALRNARRLISYFDGKESTCGLEIVLNRCNSRMVEIDEESTIKALARAVDWKVPNDHAAVRGAQNLGMPLIEQNTPVTRAILQMAKAACGKSTGLRQINPLASTAKGDKWKFWTSNNTRPAFTARS